MKFLKALVILCLVSVITVGCFEDSDDNVISASQVNDFIWKGMNLFYLYKADVPNLANDRFSSNQEYADFLNSFNDPFDLFESLIYQRQTVDRFSWIVDDYIALEQQFDGITLSNGMEFKILRFTAADTDVFGVVTHVLPSTSAESQGIMRGDIFYAVDGTQLNINNWRDLLSANSYTITLGSYNDNGTPEVSDDSIEPGTEDVSLTKVQYTENPIFINDILDVNGTQVAYLMYNGFTGTDQFNNELNDVFGMFNSANATELVLDLRYNPGGSVTTAIMLGSLITGQFTGDIFSTEEWNAEFQEAFENEDPELLINRFVNSYNGNALNSMNLERVYILTTGSSASASELVLNALDPHINVIHIGDTTAGKYQASTTLYDSPDFQRSGANQNHAYAMQPLIYKSLNANGVTDYFNGITPSEQGNQVIEVARNMGVLGDVNEPLLAVAIAHIEGTSRLMFNQQEPSIFINDSNDLVPHAKEMYVDKKIPLELLQRISQ